MHEDGDLGNFEDEKRKIGDPVAHYRWPTFILTFAKKTKKKNTLPSLAQGLEIKK